MFSFVARQAIFDEKLNTFGYELLFRDSMTNRFPDVSPEHATAQLIEEQFLGAPTGKQNEGSVVFVNFPYELLIKGLAETLPKDRVIVEILETAEPTPRLLESIKQLHKKGFRIALDDFSLSNNWNAFIPYIDIIKFDVHESTLQEIQSYIFHNKDLLKDTVFLAEKVETIEEFETYKNMGFTLFQGHFFSKPIIFKTKKIIQNQIIALRLIQEVNAETPDLIQIEELLKRDIALSFKILRYAQNILYNARGIRGSRSQSIKDIVVYLGVTELRRFVLVACLTSFNNAKTNEIYYSSLIRARFCELAANRLLGIHSSNDAFMVGLFSLLDVILEIPQEELIDQVVISADVRIALHERKGMLYQLVNLVQLYENREWEEASLEAKKVGLTRGIVAEMMNEATKWADEMPLSKPARNTFDRSQRYR